MTERRLEELSKEELIRELRKLQATEQRIAAAAGKSDRELLIHDLHVHEIELEMQNRELRESHLRLEEATARYANLYDFAPVGYVTLTPEGVIREINLTGAGLLGKHRDHLVGSPFASVAPLEDRQPFEEHLGRSRREKARVTGELTFLGDKGVARAVHVISEPVFDASGGATAFRIILIDISELKQLENRLRLLSEAGVVLSSSLEYRGTLETVVRLAVPILADLCMVDLLEEDGSAERLVAFADPRKQETLGEKLLEYRPRPGWQTAQARVVATGEPMLLSEMSPEQSAALAHDGCHADVLTAAGVRSLLVVPLSARSRTFGALTLALAESERRYTANDLRLAADLANRAAVAVDNARLYSEARRAIAARDAVLALVSHDLRDPLGVILMSASLLLKGGADGGLSPKHRKFIEPIRRSAERMNRLIRDLLDVSSIEAGRLSIERLRQPVRPLLDDTIAALRADAAAKSVVLEASFPAGERFDVDCDRDRVEQVLTNLLGNAMKFTDPGGKVVARVEPRGNEALFAVTDTGPGIPPEDLTHVFDRFWRAQKTRHAGTGLGLSIAKGIVEAHGDRIWVESRLGAGSTFYFTLPMPLPHEEQPEKRLPGAASRDRRGGAVLVAEDDPDVRDVLCETLSHAGYEVVTAENGKEALACLHREPHPILVVLDLAMPVVDGWAFLAEKNRDPALRSIPVIVVSGQGGVEDELAAADATYIPKPFEIDRLVETLHRVVHRPPAGGAAGPPA
jgi:PAS domain S-box-containing protein